MFWVVAHLGNAGLLAEIDHQPRLVAGNFVNGYLHIAEKALTPQTFGGVADIIAGHLDYIAYLEAGIAYHYIVLIVVGAVHLYVGYFVCARKSRISYLGIVHSVYGSLHLRRSAESGNNQ